MFYIKVLRASWFWCLICVSLHWWTIAEFPFWVHQFASENCSKYSILVFDWHGFTLTDNSKEFTFWVLKFALTNCSRRGISALMQLLQENDRWDGTYGWWWCDGPHSKPLVITSLDTLNRIDEFGYWPFPTVSTAKGAQSHVTHPVVQCTFWDLSHVTSGYVQLRPCVTALKLA